MSQPVSRTESRAESRALNRAWLLYGANGYTGELIARAAAAAGEQPILAGRNAGAVTALAQELGLPSRVFALDDPAALRSGLDGVSVVLHAAGPFTATAAPMIEACLHTGAHYVDITGEIAVFELAFAQHARAQAAGVVLCPGVGFDVIPTDCVAAALAAALPGVTTLALGFDSRSAPSPGTARTSLQGLGQGGKVRRGGRIVDVPLGAEVRRIDFGAGEKLAMAIPWGDVSTAFHTTGIGDVTVYMPVSSRMLRLVRALERLRRLPGASWLGLQLGARLRGVVQGPDATARAATPTWVWGEARDARGRTVRARLRTANGYDVTVHGALAAVAHLRKRRGPGGFFTPARLLGPSIAEQLPGSGRLTLEAD